MGVIDISNPLSLDGIGQVSNADPEIMDMKYPQNVFVHQEFAYVPAGNSVSIIDVSNPHTPNGVAMITNVDPEINLLSGPSAVFIDGQYAYITGGIGNASGLFIANISNPNMPDGIGQVTRLDPEINGMVGPADVIVRNNLAYVTSALSALSVINVANPNAPDGISQISHNDPDINAIYYTTKFVMDDDYAYPISGDYIGVIKISNPSILEGITQFKPSLDPQTSLATSLRGIQIKEDKLYVTSFQGALTAVIQVNK